MILLGDAATSSEELEVRKQLVGILGEEDERTLSRWVFENHRDGVRYTQALKSIFEGASVYGKQFLENLLDVAKKPKEVAQAEVAVFAWVKERTVLVVKTVQRSKDKEKAAKEELDGFMHDFVGYLHRMFPDKHRATVHGAIIGGMRHVEGKFSVDVAGIVKALFNEDPLAANAKASWAV